MDKYYKFFNNHIELINNLQKNIELTNPISQKLNNNITELSKTIGQATTNINNSIPNNADIVANLNLSKIGGIGSQLDNFYNHMSQLGYQVNQLYKNTQPVYETINLLNAHRAIFSTYDKFESYLLKFDQESIYELEQRYTELLNRYLDNNPSYFSEDSYTLEAVDSNSLQNIDNIDGTQKSIKSNSIFYIYIIIQLIVELILPYANLKTNIDTNTINMDTNAIDAISIIDSTLTEEESVEFINENRELLDSIIKRAESKSQE